MLVEMEYYRVSNSSWKEMTENDTRDITFHYPYSIVYSGSSQGNGWAIEWEDDIVGRLIPKRTEAIKPFDGEDESGVYMLCMRSRDRESFVGMVPVVVTENEDGRVLCYTICPVIVTKSDRRMDDFIPALTPLCYHLGRGEASDRIVFCRYARPVEYDAVWLPCGHVTAVLFDGVGPALRTMEPWPNPSSILNSGHPPYRYPDDPNKRIASGGKARRYIY